MPFAGQVREASDGWQPESFRGALPSPARGRSRARRFGRPRASCPAALERSGAGGQTLASDRPGVGGKAHSRRRCRHSPGRCALYQGRGAGGHPDGNAAGARDQLRLSQHHQVIRHHGRPATRERRPHRPRRSCRQVRERRAERQRHHDPPARRDALGSLQLHRFVRVSERVSPRSEPRLDGPGAPGIRLRRAATIRARNLIPVLEYQHTRSRRGDRRRHRQDMVRGGAAAAHQ